MKVKIMEEFGELVPPNITFSIGYFGHQSVKHWLCTTDDLNAMYKAHNPLKGKMQLWCEGRKPMEELETPKPKRRKLCQREEKESLVEEISHELKEKNEENYDFSEAQYRLWARMIVTGVHSSKDHPPQIPMLTGTPLKRKTKEATVNDSIVGAAAAIAKALTVASSQTTIVNSPQSLSPSSSRFVATGQQGVSPGRAADIRGNQLSMLKKLYEKGVLSQREFDEQKDIILNGLRKL